MSKTPITDAAEILVCHVDERGVGFLKAVPVEVCRKLELELRNAKDTSWLSGALNSGDGTYKP